MSTMRYLFGNENYDQALSLAGSRQAGKILLYP